MTRKERDFLRQRKEIMLTALTLFSEKGFSSVSMQEIAQKSEFAVGTLYKFFPTKDALYGEILKEKVMELHSLLIEALNIRGNEIKKLKTFVERKIQWFKQNIDYVRLYVTETIGMGFINKDELNQIKEKIHNELIFEIRRLFKSGIEKKLFKEIDPYLLALSFNGIANGFLFEMIDNKEIQKINPDIILDIFLNSVSLKGLQ
jgi:AcrR family transcriptional regulator